jgi:F-type H+-transporting ATPase subunit b
LGVKSRAGALITNGFEVMHTFALLADQASGGQLEQIARTFGVDWQHLIAQMISFGIVCFVLYRFAYRPVLAILEQRRQQIAESLSNAEKIKAELARTEAQATKMIEEARAAAKRVEEKETQKARAAAEQILVKAREAAERDHDRMLAELKREVGRLVVQTTATVTGKILTPEDQQRLAEEAAKQLAS